MSDSMIGASVSRQELLEEYQRSPESAPLKLPSLRYTTLAEDYRFERLMARIAGATAAELVENAVRDAHEVKKGTSWALATGFVALLLGMAVLLGTPTYVPLVIVGLPIMYFSVGRIRKSNDKIRRANYDRRFATDVARYAALVADQKTGPSATAL